MTTVWYIVISYIIFFFKLFVVLFRFLEIFSWVNQTASSYLYTCTIQIVGFKVCVLHVSYSEFTPVDHIHHNPNSTQLCILKCKNQVEKDCIFSYTFYFYLYNEFILLLVFFFFNQVEL